MKKIKILISFFVLLLMFACKDASTAQESRIISVDEMHQVLQNDPKIQLVDVRTAEEFKEGRLRDSKNICVTDDDFKERVASLDKEQPIYVYCRSGKRSARAAEILKEMGFKEIYDIEGGITNWEEHNFETEN